jgi:hypothetical protein
MLPNFLKPDRRFKLAAALCLAGSLATLAWMETARAQGAAKSPEQIAASIPTEVPEVHTGGSWQDGSAQGVFRTITVLASKDNTAHVFIQWISLKADSPIPEIAKTVLIKEVSDKKLPNAFVTLEADKEGEATIVVASFDPATNKDVAVAFKATKPGSYAATKIPEYNPAGATGAAPAPAPAKK